MKKVNLIFPNQLFKNSPLILEDSIVYLIEEFLFFKQYKFHKQKIAYHRATMKRYEDYLKFKKCKVVYVNSYEEISDIRKLIPFIKSKGISVINYIDPVDNYLQKRIESGCDTNSIERTVFDSPLFLNTKDDLKVFFRKDKKKYHQQYSILMLMNII